MKNDMTAEETKKIPEPAPAPSVEEQATPGQKIPGTDASRQNAPGINTPGPDASGQKSPGSNAPGSKRRFPSFGDVLAMLGIALGAQILVSVLALPVLLVAGHGTDMASLPPAALGRMQAILYLVSMSVALLGVLYYRRLRGGRGTWVRCSLRGFNPALLLWAFLLIVAVGVVIEPLLRLLPAVHLDVGRGAWTILMLVVMAPVFEELLCRGVVLGSLRARYGVTVAWLASSIFFGVMHIQPAQVISASIIGLILGFVYLSTESIWSVMILHALNNAVAYLLLMAGYEQALLIDLVESRTLYVVIYIVALALSAISGFMMVRALRKMKSPADGAKKSPADKNPSAA